MCGSQIEESQDCNAYSARLISQRVSRSGPHQLDPNTLFALEDETAACNGGDTTCQNKGLTKTCCNSIGGPLSSEDWNLTLCYGCRVTLQDVVRCLIRFYSYLLILFSHLSFLSLISFFFYLSFSLSSGWGLDSYHRVKRNICQKRYRKRSITDCSVVKCDSRCSSFCCNTFDLHFITVVHNQLRRTEIH